MNSKQTWEVQQEKAYNEDELLFWNEEAYRDIAEKDEHSVP